MGTSMKVTKPLVRTRPEVRGGHLFCVSQCKNEEIQQKMKKNGEFVAAARILRFCRPPSLAKVCHEECSWPVEWDGFSSKIVVDSCICQYLDTILANFAESISNLFSPQKVSGLCRKYHPTPCEGTASFGRMGFPSAAPPHSRKLRLCRLRAGCA